MRFPCLAFLFHICILFGGFEISVFLLYRSGSALYYASCILGLPGFILFCALIYTLLLVIIKKRTKEVLMVGCSCGPRLKTYIKCKDFSLSLNLVYSHKIGH